MQEHIVALGTIKVKLKLLDNSYPFNDEQERAYLHLKEALKIQQSQILQQAKEIEEEEIYNLGKVQKCK